MKKCFRVFILSHLLLLSVCYGQKISTPLITADSLAGGNYKDVFKSFFQLAFNKLTGPKKEIQFTSNPFALMAKANPKLLVDTNYIKYTALRNINFAFSVNLDSSYRFNGFSSGIKYAIINKRDYTISRAFVIEAFNANKEYGQLARALAAYATANYSGDQLTRFVDQVNKLLAGKLTFDKIDKSLQEEIKRYAKEQSSVYFLNLITNDPKVDFKKASQQSFDKIKKTFENKLLLTIGLSDTTYKDQFFFSNILLKTELLKGMGNAKPGSNWEFNIQAAVNFLDDTLSGGRDLKRTILNFEPGINWVIRNKANEQSFLEFKCSGSYNHNFTRLYVKEKRDSITFNATLRIRIINDVWIPLEIKYDPKSGNVFGFLNVRANFTGLGKFIKGI